MIADPMNVAARVEAYTRVTGASILLTEATRRLLSEEERDGLEERGEVPLRGKSEPVPVYAADFRADARPIPRKGYIKAEA